MCFKCMCVYLIWFCIVHMNACTDTYLHFQLWSVTFWLVLHAADAAANKGKQSVLMKKTKKCEVLRNERILMGE